MSKKRSVRGGVAGLVFACALVSASSLATQADTVVSSIAVGSGPVGVAINPAGTFAYVTNAGSNTVSKISLATDTVVASIPTVYLPSSVAINPAGTFAYVTNSNYYGANFVSKINLATDTVVATILTDGAAADIVIDPTGLFAYITMFSADEIAKIDLTTFAVVSTIDVDKSPQQIVIDPSGVFAYVTHASVGRSVFSKIDLATFTVADTLRVGLAAQGIAINPVGTFAYVANGDDGTISKINLSTFSVANTIDIEGYPFSIAINPAGTFAYVTNWAISNKVIKLNLASNTVAAKITVKTGLQALVINNAGTFAYTTNTIEGLVSKIALSATAGQTISFIAPSTQLTGSGTETLTATASSNLAVAFSTGTSSVCTVSGVTVTLVSAGDCTIRADQAGGSGWDPAPRVTRTFKILPSPPSGEVGVSIEDGDSYTNSKQVTLNLVWPEYATAVRISNDGGFAASKTQTKDLAASIDWELDDSVKGIYTKVVYVRFNGVANTKETYTDDIILDTTAPTITSTDASTGTSTITLSLAATDDITGVDNIQIMAGDTTVTKNYATDVSVPLANLGLVVSTSSINSMSVATAKSLSVTTIKVRVSDSAGNWTRWRIVSVSGKALAPKLTPKISASPAVVAWYAGLAVPTGAKVLLKVSPSTAAICRVAGTTLKGLKVGSCKVTVTVTPKKGTATSKTVTLKVTT